MRRVAGWIASLSYLAAVATLATWAFAWIVTDRWPWTQWIWWFPWLGYAAACFPAAAIAVFDRRPGGRRLRAAALLAGPVIAACGIFRDVGFTPRPVAGPSTLRIVQWNAPWPDTEAAAGPSGTIADRDADLVVISNPWRFFQSRKAEWTDRGYDVVQTGTFAFASRLPVLEARPLRAPPGSALAIVRIDARATWGRPVSVLAVDLPSDPKSSRMAFMSRIVDAIAVLEPGSLDAIVGDFNITRGSASLATAFPAHREAFSQAGSGWGASFEEPWPLLHIDLLLAGPGVQVDWCRLWSVGPRHRAQETWIRPAGQS